MKTSRRAFTTTITLGSLTLIFDPGIAFGQDDCTLPTPGTATRFVPAEPKVVERITAADLGQPARATALQAYRAAFDKIRHLPDTDVVGWTKQIAQHCIQCAPENNKNIHFDWQYVGWHRAYLYFLERVLRSSIGGGNDDLRLVYWDWENPNSRRLPDIFAPTGQSLYYDSRGDLNGPNWPLTDEDVDVQGLLAIPDFSRFGGTATQRKPVPAIFSGPHANVHNNFDPGDMADLQFSPRDPVFYAHHANIDRVWSSWVAAGHSNPDFGSAKVYFYDETRTWRYVLLNDLRDETKLGYRYSTVIQPTEPIRSLTTSRLARRNDDFVMPSGSVPLLRSRPNAPAFLLITNLQNLETLPETTRQFGIFSKPVGAGVKASPESGYLGKVTRVFSRQHAHLGPLSASLNVTGKVSNLTASTDGALKLFVAPLTHDETTTAAGVPLAAEAVSLIR
jgi:hypothetical protein